MSFSSTSQINADLLDQYYQRWLDDPNSVDGTWRAFFDGFTLAANGATPELLHSPAGTTAAALAEHRQARVDSLIFHYRSIGHLQAHLDPLGDPPLPHPRLTLTDFGLSEADLDFEYDVGHYLSGGPMRLRDLIANLHRTYCGVVGVEYIHIQDTAVRRWLQARMEPMFNQPAFDRTQKVRILRRLHKAETFERFLHTRFLGQKRFSLEGAETLIPLLDIIVEFCPALGIKELVMGMAHRGRLNVLASVFRKSFEFVFEEFSENYIANTVAGDGDVKYHLGYENEVTTSSGGTVGLRLAANPSHLEAVDPVVEGKARARHETPESRTAADPRRRRLCRSGHRRGNSQFLPAPRLPHRRHHPCRGEQSDRFHDQSGRSTLQPVLHGHRQDDRGSDLPRQRRPPRTRVHGG